MHKTKLASVLAALAIAVSIPVSSAQALPACPVDVAKTIQTPNGVAAAFIKYVKSTRHLDVVAVSDTAMERRAPAYTVGIHKCQTIGTGGQVIVDTWKGSLPKGVLVGYLVSASIRQHTPNVKPTVFGLVAKVHGVWRVLTLGS